MTMNERARFTNLTQLALALNLTWPLEFVVCGQDLERLRGWNELVCSWGLEGRSDKLLDDARTVLKLLFAYIPRRSYGLVWIRVYTHWMCCLFFFVSWSSSCLEAASEPAITQWGTKKQQIRSKPVCSVQTFQVKTCSQIKASLIELSRWVVGGAAHLQKNPRVFWRCAKYRFFWRCAKYRKRK